MNDNDKIPKLFSTDVLKDLVEKYGTPESVAHAWQTRHAQGEVKHEEEKKGRSFHQNEEWHNKVKSGKMSREDALAQLDKLKADYNEYKANHPGDRSVNGALKALKNDYDRVKNGGGSLKSSAAKTMFSMTKENGGGTFRYGNGGSMKSVKEGIAVAEDVKRGRIIAADGMSADDFAKYFDKHADVLTDPEGGKCLGSWINEGKCYLDITTVYPESKLEEAKASGRKHNQKKVFNIRTMEEIDTGGTGEVEDDQTKVKKDASGFYGIR